MTTEQQPPTIIMPHIVGGVSELRDISEADLEIWNANQKHIEKKIRDHFHVPENHPLKPVKVATQVVAGRNYFFRVELHDKKFATARVYCKASTEKNESTNEDVAVHNQSVDDVNETLHHF